MMLKAARMRGACAVLAVGVVVASVLAAAAGSVAAVTDRADHGARLSACVGAAGADRQFVDVSAGHAHRSAINCIAYYGITRGTGDGSAFAPNAEVTRAQMAVFVARAARVAGVDLGAVSRGGFGDLDGTWAEARDAIDRLASAGIIAPGGSFRPGDAITRAEMAEFLFGLLSRAAPNVVVVGAEGEVLLGPAGSRTPPDDHFGDADSTEVSVLYELGVTTGASAAAVQDATMPPLDFDYEPDGTVDRGQMAAFITRALAHTSARPAGVTAQYDAAGVVVSVRDDRFQPVQGAAVDVFWAAAGSAWRALAGDGTCRRSELTGADESRLVCEIDAADPITGRGGDARVEVAGLRRVPEGGAAVWAWTGERGDTLDAGSSAHRLDLDHDQPRSATRALITTSIDARKVRFGNSVVYSIQLQDPVGDVRRGLDGAGPAYWRLSVQPQAPDRDPIVQQLVSGPSGRVDFAVALADPNPAGAGDLAAVYTLTPASNAPAAYVTFDADGRTASTGTVTFSDAPASIGPGDATVTIDTAGYVRLIDGGAANSATVTVLDQYGVPFPATTVRLASSLSAATLDGTAEFAVDVLGSHRFSYRYRGGAAAETLTAHYRAPDGSGGTKTATVYWAGDAEPSGQDSTVRSGDVLRDHIVVDGGTGPVLLAYDDNDRFDIDGRPATLAAFEAELAKAIKRRDGSRRLTWSSYQPDNRSPVTRYNLS